MLTLNYPPQKRKAPDLKVPLENNHFWQKDLEFPSLADIYFFMILILSSCEDHTGFIMDTRMEQTLKIGSPIITHKNSPTRFLQEQFLASVLNLFYVLASMQPICLASLGVVYKLRNSA